MKVFNLRCTAGHGFEGWFGSEEDWVSQQARGLIECPLCGDRGVERLPSAPRLNLGAGKPEAAAPTPPMPGAGGPPMSPERAGVEALWLQAVRHVMARTEDVGERFAEEARRIHHGEVEERGIRGQTSAEELQALQDEGIEVFSLPVPDALKGPAH
jgi:hypothetical protein